MTSSSTTAPVFHGGGASDPSDTEFAGLAFGFGPFWFDSPSYQLFRDGKPIPITPKAFAVLQLLLRHRDRVVSRQEIKASVWPDSIAKDDNLTQCVRAIRRALGDDPVQPGYVNTIPGRGYRFIAPVTRMRVPIAVDAVPNSPTDDAVDLPVVARSASSPSKDHGTHGVFFLPLALGAVLGTVLTAIAFGIAIRSRETGH